MQVAVIALIVGCIWLGVMVACLLLPVSIHNVSRLVNKAMYLADYVTRYVSITALTSVEYSIASFL